MTPEIVMDRWSVQGCEDFGRLLDPNGRDVGSISPNGNPQWDIVPEMIAYLDFVLNFKLDPV
jgi:hypothetical protein